MKINAEAVRAKIGDAKTFVDLDHIAEVTDVVAELALQESEHLLVEMRQLLAECALQACQSSFVSKHR